MAWFQEVQPSRTPGTRASARGPAAAAGALRLDGARHLLFKMAWKSPSRTSWNPGKRAGARRGRGGAATTDAPGRVAFILKRVDLSTFQQNRREINLYGTHTGHSLTWARGFDRGAHLRAEFSSTYGICKCGFGLRPKVEVHTQSVVATTANTLIGLCISRTRTPVCEPASTTHTLFPPRTNERAQ